MKSPALPLIVLAVMSMVAACDGTRLPDGEDAGPDAGNLDGGDGDGDGDGAGDGGLVNIDAGVGDGGSVDDVRECPFIADVSAQNERLIFGDPDGDTEVLLYRIAAGQGAGHTVIYEPGGFGLDFNGIVTCVDDPTLLTYVGAHHNWVEHATALVDGLTWSLDITFQPEGDPVSTPFVWKYVLEATDVDDAVVVGPLELELLEGQP